MPKVLFDLLQFLKTFIEKLYLYLYCLFSLIIGFLLCYFLLNSLNYSSTKTDLLKTNSVEKTKPVPIISPTTNENVDNTPGSLINFEPNMLYVGEITVRYPTYSEFRGIDIAYKNDKNKPGKVRTSKEEEIGESDFKKLLYSFPVKETANSTYNLIENSYILGEGTNLDTDEQILIKLNKDKAEIVFEHKYNYVSKVADCSDNLNDNRFYVTKVIANKFVVINYICAVGTEPSNLKESKIPQYLLNSET